MRFIAADFFARSPMLVLPVVAMLIFMLVFMSTAIRAFRTDKAKQDKLARLPLEEELGHD
jgi:hypothetical protein